MKPLNLFYLIFALAGLLGNGPARAETKTIHDMLKKKTSQVVESLNSGNWRERDLAVCVASQRWAELNAKKDQATPEELVEKDRIALGLIKLLERSHEESEKWWEEYAKTEYKVRPPPRSPCEDCHINLVEAVMDLNDKRALKALIGAVHNGREISDRVASYGKEAIAPLIERSKITKDDDLKGYLLYTLAKIAKRQDVDVGNKSKIKDLLKKGLNDAEWSVRKGAIKGVSELNDPEFIPLVEETLVREELDPKTKKMKHNLVKIYGEKTLGKLRAKKREIEEAKKNKNSQNKLQPGTTQGINVP